MNVEPGKIFRLPVFVDLDKEGDIFFIIKDVNAERVYCHELWPPSRPWPENEGPQKSFIEKQHDYNNDQSDWPLNEWIESSEDEITAFKAKMELLR
jgi:hypothetical protein